MLLTTRVLIVVIVLVGFFHLATVSQIPPVGVLEGWYASPSYTHYKLGTFDDTMFPGLAEFENGPFGQGKLRYWIQSITYNFLDFGLFQARFPMLLGGFLSAYLIFLLGRYLFDPLAGLFSAALFLLAPVFYNAHVSQSHSWVVVCFLLAAYCFVRMLAEKRNLFACISGAAIGLSVSFHFTGALGVFPLSILLIYYRFRRDLRNSNVVFFFLGGLFSFAVWYLLEITPIGLDAFLKKSSYGVQVAGSTFVGMQWVQFFLMEQRGAIVELPLLVGTLVSVSMFWTKTKTQFLYLFFVGLVVAYTLFSGSGEVITVWALIFVLTGGVITCLLREPLRSWTLQMKTWCVVLIVVLLFYGAVQAKRVYTALYIRPGDEFVSLTTQLVRSVPEGQVVMGAPLYFFGFAGRNPYITQNFYWERMNKQTHELGDFEQQSSSVSTRNMMAFLKRRGVDYFIVDGYFQEAIKRWIPEARWNDFFDVEAEFQNSVYGASAAGGPPPYRIQIWRMKDGDK